MKADRTVFLDTSYVFALFNTSDQWHPTATAWAERVKADNYSFLTTEYILVEIADGMSSVRLRQEGGKIVRSLLISPTVTIVSALTSLFDRALQLFESREDKTWGITDCASFLVMDDFEVRQALTTDDDFRQAGFTALLLS